MEKFGRLRLRLVGLPIRPAIGLTSRITAGLGSALTRGDGHRTTSVAGSMVLLAGAGILDRSAVGIIGPRLWWPSSVSAAVDSASDLDLDTWVGSRWRLSRLCMPGGAAEQAGSQSLIT